MKQFIGKNIHTFAD